ncbi:MAG: glycoside hydrolase family 3 N-terminal domain-containing protein [Dysgonamonadaceae bacterium]
MNTKKHVILLGCLALMVSHIPLHAQAKQPARYITVAGKKFVDLNGNGKLDKYEDTRLALDVRLNDLLTRMTDEEKANLLIGTGMPGFDGLVPIVGYVEKGKVPGAAGGTYGISRLGIPEVIVADGPAGLRIAPTRPNTTQTFYATAFPIGSALSSSWNPELVKSVGKAMGNEVKEYGVDVLLAPALNIQRNPLNGRNFEYYSEDPLIAGKIAAAYVSGVQSNGVGTSVKHFAANNQETNRLNINEHISERAMREIYLRGFETVVKEANPWTVMSSYNKINGEWTSQSHDLLTTILRDEWGYKGVVMTDWFGGYPNLQAANNPDYVSDVVKQQKAGNDLLMPGMKNQKIAILKAMKDGTLSRWVVDRNVKRILALVFKSPAFAGYKYSDIPDLKAHAKVSRHAATEGMVLLKNEANTLPYKASGGAVALFGVTSYNFYAGGTGSGDVNKAYTVSLLEGLNNAGYQLNKVVEDAYKPFVAKALKAEKERMAREGIFGRGLKLEEMSAGKDFYDKAAETSSIAFITLGRSSGEGVDRMIEGDFDLTDAEQNLISLVTEAFHAKGKKVVVVLNVGGVVETSSWKAKPDAILLAWQAGQEGGNAVADVLSGNQNPSGKLPMTFPVRYEDHASAKNWHIDTKSNWMGTDDPQSQDVTYQEGVYVGYRYFNTFKVKPSYEFGYGLSYTNFVVENLKLSSSAFAKEILVTVDVTNTGKTAGKEVVQLYLSAPARKLDKPAEELKGFVKTKLLQPGEKQTISMVLKPQDLASFDPKVSAWVAEAGTYQVLVGTSSLDIRQKASFALSTDRVVEKTHPVFTADKKFEDLRK